MSALIAVLPWLLIAGFIGFLGKDRKFGFWGNFLVSFILTPIIGLLVYFAQSPKAKA